MPEAKLVINRDPGAAPDEPNRFANAKAANVATAEQIRARRKQIHE